VWAKDRWKVGKVTDAWLEKRGLAGEVAGLLFRCGGEVLQGEERVGDLPHPSITVTRQERPKP
jgi:hypothetical protein